MALVSAICSICIRGGSKGVPLKNIRPMAGMPLFMHSVEQARSTGIFDAIAVSSDDPQILRLAQENGVAFTVPRPPELATDTAAKMAAIRHCVEAVELISGTAFGVMVDIDATSPLRLPSDIVAAVDLLNSAGAGNVITGAPARRSPYFNMVERAPDGRVRLCKTLDRPLVRRQDAPECFDMNASIYVWRREAFWTGNSLITDDTRLLVMPEERSVDIDTEMDWAIVEFLLERQRQRQPH